MLDPWSTTFQQDFDIQGFAEGLIFPQRGGLLNTRFFKNKNRADEFRPERCHRELPDFIRVLVGTRKALEEWLKAAGPGSCTLWVEMAEEYMGLSKPDIAHRLLKGHLQLAYRLRSFTPLLQPVLHGMHVIVSPEVPKGEGSMARKESFDDQAFGSPVCGKWYSLRQREKEKFLKSIGVNHLGDDFCIKYEQAHQGLSQSRNWIRRWLLALPIGSYGQLVSMILPGGTLWQFQQLVGKIVHNSNFVDVKFELIDFMRWLEHHAYVTVLEGLDFLVSLSTMQWTVVKFNFAENILNITGDKCLDSLQHVWQEKMVDDSMSDGKSVDNCILNPSDEKRGKSVGCPGTVKWKIWHPSNQECSLQHVTLLEAMYSEGGFSEQQAIGAFKQDFGFLAGMEEPKTEDFSLSSRVLELRSCCLTGSPPLSSKERCALSNLGSSSRTVRQRGIHILLNILLGEVKGKFSNGRGLSTPMSASSLCCAYNGMDMKGSTPSSGDLSSNESSRALSGIEKGEYYKGRVSTRKQFKSTLSVQNEHDHESSPCPSHRKDTKHELPELQLDSHAQKAPLSSDGRHAKESEGTGIISFFQVLCKGPNASEDGSKIESVQMKMLEWVQGGFLESLIEEAIDSPGKSISRGEAGLGVEETADICLKITSVLPADGSSRLVESMMVWLKDYTCNKSLLNCIIENDGLKLQENGIDIDCDIYMRDNRDKKMGGALEKG